MSTVAPNGERRLRADEAYRLVWDSIIDPEWGCVFIRGEALPHIAHAKELVDAGHPYGAVLKPILDLGDHEYDRAQHQQANCVLVLNALREALVLGKTTAYIETEPGIPPGIVAANQWSGDELWLRAVGEIEAAFSARPAPYRFGFVETELRKWLKDDPRAESVAKDTEKRGRPKSVDEDYLRSELLLMEARDELLGIRSKAKACEELQRRYQQTKRNAKAPATNTIEKACQVDLKRIFGTKNRKKYPAKLPDTPAM
jgi:hypothetical protein